MFCLEADSSLQHYSDVIIGFSNIQTSRHFKAVPLFIIWFSGPSLELFVTKAFIRTLFIDGRYL